MAKRRKQKNKKIRHSSIESESIGGIEVSEESSITKKDDFNYTKNPTKPIEKVKTEKVKVAPQTFIEDTFDLNEQIDNSVEITNEVLEKQKMYKSKDELLQNTVFKNKLHKAITRVEFNKGFDFLLDFSASSKAFKTYEIDEKYDDFDFILEKVSEHFIINLAKVKIKYEDYQNINWYFSRLKSLYNDYKHKEMAERELLNSDLQKMKSMSNLIRWTFF